PADDSISHALRELESEVKASAEAQTRSRQRWGWIGAGLIFMSSLLCGGLFAGYVGWQLVNRDLMTAQPGTVSTLPSAQAPAAQPQLYIFVTATSEPPAAPTAGETDAGQPPAPSPGELAGEQTFPEAVTPTPVLVQPQLAASAQAAAPLPPDEQLPSIVDAATASATGPGAIATPPVNVQLEIPTRRPTPVLDIPTSTPASDQLTPTVTPTPTPEPILGTPVVIFSAQDTALQEGDCTTVSWYVENVRAVFYENLGVNGQGEKEECIDDDPDTYNLTVILADGSTRTYTTTVDLIIPTATPAPTPTFTEAPEPTPTWTPNLPTATPTLATTYGVRLEVSGSAELSCTRGATCETDLFLTNTGSGLDSLTLFFTEAGAWSRQLCRLDGVCATDRLTLVNMGAGNTGVVRLRITVPENAEAGAVIYRLRAATEGNGGASVSDEIVIQAQLQ
ncbi:MAG TPA: hypothetical protein VNK95_03470, partial [Caldilineaceae bacterium]|nr:hypothetical protein [Caldilineaceae bacterium]